MADKKIDNKTIELRKKLKVKDAYKIDAGRGRIRIDPEVIKDMNLKTGDVIEIYHPISEKRTAAMLYPGKEEDKGRNSVRIDSSLRRNLDASLDDIVEIRKIEASLAERITFAGLEESIILRTPQQITQILENRLVTMGDILSFNAMGRRIDFVVIDYYPKAEVVRIHLDTKINISEKTHKEFEEIETEKVTYEDIGGLNEEIQKIREIVELPLKHPELFKKLNINPPNGILLYGKSGVGKTLLVKAISQETNAHFITVNAPEVFRKFSGESEKVLNDIFREAKENTPSIIFIDKIDIITPRNDIFTERLEKRILAQLIFLMDGIRNRENVIIIAETNRLDDIDETLKRFGRFDRIIEIKPPDIEGRYEILQIHTRGMPLHEDVDLQVIAERTQGFVGADLEALVKEAAILTMREILPKIEGDKTIPPEILNTLEMRMEHFLTALESIKPSTLN